jgi:AcrR family transcriptional regulator
MRRTDRSRAQILDAAAVAFRELGFDGASLEEIATRAGLTRKTIYNLFGSKEDIALSLIARAEAADTGYRARIAANEDAVTLIEMVLSDSAQWCLANPALARLALAPHERPSSEPPPDRPSFQGLVRDLVVLGQKQGRIRQDEPAGFMALILLGIYGQAMLSALPEGVVNDSDIRRIVRLVVEGIGKGVSPASRQLQDGRPAICCRYVLALREF